MDKRDKIKTSLNKQGNSGKISSKATDVIDRSTDDMSPVFSFRHVCSTHCKLSDWRGNEVNLLIKLFQKMEAIPWKDIRGHSGLNYKPVDHYIYKLPEDVPKDITLHELRVDGDRRIFGYRGERVFYLIWFDRNHEVCPQNKSKKKRA